VVTSDAHALDEIGRDDAVRPILERTGFPESLIVNRTARHAFGFIDRRRAVKRQVLASIKSE
jgi:histidinol phosphatase-like PHP family hydrolase